MTYIHIYIYTYKCEYVFLCAYAHTYSLYMYSEYTHTIYTYMGHLCMHIWNLSCFIFLHALYHHNVISILQLRKLETEA